MTTTALTTTLRRLALVGALGVGLFGIAVPAGADPIPAGPGDITACPPHVDCDGPNLPDGPGDITAPEPGDDPGPFDGPDDFTAPEPGDDPGDGDDTGGDALPEAEVGDVVVANPTFTG